jgi:ATP-binding cassette subfamily B (MDR/TAP) protein 1
VVRERYRQRLEEEVRDGLLRDLGLAVLYAFSQSVTFFCSALIFWYGGVHLITTGEYTVRDFLICFVATTYSAQAAGSIFAFAPDIAGGREAADRLKKLIETVPVIGADSTKGKKAAGIAGDVELSDVDFVYPGPPGSKGNDRLILNKTSFQAKRGSFVALVGASGSGKTTALGMLERFYDPRSGRVLADGLDIRQYRLQEYRKQLALVDQDAVLYSGTIRDNLITDADADEQAIEKACREANIWELVVSCSLISSQKSFMDANLPQAITPRRTGHPGRPKGCPGFRGSEAAPRHCQSPPPQPQDSVSLASDIPGLACVQSLIRAFTLQTPRRGHLLARLEL